MIVASLTVNTHSSPLSPFSCLTLFVPDVPGHLHSHDSFLFPSPSNRQREPLVFRIERNEKGKSSCSAGHRSCLLEMAVSCSFSLLCHQRRRRKCATFFPPSLPLPFFRFLMSFLIQHELCLIHAVRFACLADEEQERHRHEKCWRRRSCRWTCSSSRCRCRCCGDQRERMKDEAASDTTSKRTSSRPHKKRKKRNRKSSITSIPLFVLHAARQQSGESEWMLLSCVSRTEERVLAVSPFASSSHAGCRSCHVLEDLFSIISRPLHQ